ncbi:hypothetical protein HMPREF9081_1377 [Centipeda periodontii DSM 2778]|uniref:Phosphohydrolase n=1 Tax=Centipeda periodontii DSM 2778 TaxID=888060 RepID=F5RM91_9FIRM|nr:HD domain-containing protein [Centipeda periodontii]EGK59782.1 hypothetical protein HMPREF9081_1377 [Centipeda periodontii DSM 2778]
MKQRIHQFIRALCGRMGPEGHLFVRSYLSLAERDLFYAMHAADQYHAFRVALTAKDLYAKRGCMELDTYILLIRCALLHDIGRVKGAADIWGKVFAVLADRFAPSVIPYFIRRKDTYGICGRIGMAFYIYVSHPYIGADRLRAIGDVAEADIIQYHQKKPAPEDSLVLSILKQADAQN